MPSFEEALGESVSSLDAVLTLSRISYERFKRHRGPAGEREELLQEATGKLQLAAQLITTAIESPRPGRDAPEQKLRDALRKQRAVVDRRLHALLKHAGGAGGGAPYLGGPTAGGALPGLGAGGSTYKRSKEYELKLALAQRTASASAAEAAADAERARLDAAAEAHAGAKAAAAAERAASEAEGSRVVGMQRELAAGQAEHAREVTVFQRREVEEVVQAVAAEVDRQTQLDALAAEQARFVQQQATAAAAEAVAALALQAERTATQAEADRVKAAVASAALVRRWHDRQTNYGDLRLMLGAHAHHSSEFAAEAKT
eukprot:SAG22_NODE_144_length_17700_cov_21.959207_3_plen_316_part_00